MSGMQTKTTRYNAALVTLQHFEKITVRQKVVLEMRQGKAVLESKGWAL